MDIDTMLKIDMSVYLYNTSDYFWYQCQIYNRLPHTLQPISLIAIPDYDAVIYWYILHIHLDSRAIRKRRNHRNIHFWTVDPYCYLILVRCTNHSVLGLTPMVSVVVVMVLVVNHGKAVCLINCLYLINTQTLSSSSLPTQLDLAY